MGSTEATHRLAAWVGGISGIAVLGYFDYLSGFELRFYPLYYGPIALLAWYGGRRGAAAGAAGSVAAWFLANRLAGMRFSAESLWVANAMIHGTSFLFVGLLVATLRDALANMRSLSRTDPLTSLRNSRAFYEDAIPLLSLCRRRGRPVTIAYLDLDHFKSVNDSQGHKAGDELLRAVAHALRAVTRPSDLSSRLGGDEFAILLPDLGTEEAAILLERIRAEANAALAQTPEVTASIGAVTFLVAPSDVDTLLHHADTLMYRAKATGRNRIVAEVVDTTELAPSSGAGTPRAGRPVAGPLARASAPVHRHSPAPSSPNGSGEGR